MIRNFAKSNTLTKQSLLHLNIGPALTGLESPSYVDNNDDNLSTSSIGCWFSYKSNVMNMNIIPGSVHI